MIKKIKFVTILVVIFSIFTAAFTKISYAADFSLEYDIKHTVTNDFKLITDYYITITNNIKDDFISKSQVKFPFKPDSVSAKDDKGNLVSSYEKDSDGNYILSVDLKPALGVGIKTKFTLSVLTSEAVVKNGNLIQVEIPGFTANESNKVNSVSLKISNDLPQIKYISYPPLTNDSTNRLDVSEKSFKHYLLPDSNPLIIMMGDKMKYSFSLKVNPEDKFVYYPSDTSRQNMIVKSISPSPNDALVDNDSNIALSFNTKDPVTVTGEVEVLTDKYKEDQAVDPNVSLQNTYWQNDDRLKDIENKVRNESSYSQKVKETFDFILSKVKYSTKAEMLKRLTTKEILDSDSPLHTLNISDLSIAILRSAGVNTRLVAGFVDSQSKSSFSSDGLQYWIEYYDPTFLEWKNADPTLQIISSSENYFDGVGLSHIEIFKTSNGWNMPTSSNYNFSANVQEGGVNKTDQMSVEIKTPKVQSGKDKYIDIEIKNNGTSIVNIDTLSVIFENDTSSAENTNIKKIIFPNQSIFVDVKIKNTNYYEDKALNTQVIINTLNKSYTFDKQLKFEKSGDIVVVAAIVGGIILIIIFGVIVYTRKKLKITYIVSSNYKRERNIPIFKKQKK